MEGLGSLGNLEHLIKEQMKKDYTKREEKFVVLQDDYKKIINNIKDKEGNLLNQRTKRRLYVAGMVFIKSMNDSGFNNWFPDFIKDNATKLFLMNMLENETFIKEMKDEA